MKASQTVTAIIHLPRTFYDLGNVSAQSLLRDSGYLNNAMDISESAILEALLAQPECVDEWMRFSEDKRTCSGWFFREGPKGFQVGSYPEGTLIDYFDKSVACAAYIKRELEDMRAETRRPSV